MSASGMSVGLAQIRIRRSWWDTVAKVENCGATHFSRKYDAGDEIRSPSIALPKVPVSLTREEVFPHIFTRKTRLQSAEFLITHAKRLLQQFKWVSGHGAYMANPALLTQRDMLAAEHGRALKKKAATWAALSSATRGKKLLFQSA